MGVDVARFGNDKTVIIIRQGPRVIYIDELRKSDIVNTTGAVVTAALRYKVKDIIIDEIGVGAGFSTTSKPIDDSTHKDSTALTVLPTTKST